MTPKVSILMPLNRSDFLEHAVESILNQRFADFELLVIDDAGGGLGATVQALSRGDPRVRVVPYSGPPGLAQVLNFGLARCSGSLVARADGDDIYHRDRLARQVAEMDARAGLVALSVGWHRIDAQGKRLFTHQPVTGPDTLRVFAKFGAPLLHPGAMMRRQALRDVGGYDTALWTAQDSDLWNRLAAVGEIDNLTAPLVSWRAHRRSVTSSRGATGRDLSLGVVAKHLGTYLGQNLSGRDVAEAVDIWRGDAGRDDTLLRHVARAVRAREPRVVYRAVCRHVARSYARRAMRSKDIACAVAALRWGLS